MRRVLVTGGNKGIGAAIVEAIVAEHADAFVYLGARDPERGDAAVAEIAGRLPNAAERIEVVPLDVGEDGSVATALAAVTARAGADRLYGVVNNAALGVGGGSFADLLNTNVLGVHRVSSAFSPLVHDGGRIVNVTSAAGPNFVASCSPERQRFLTDPGIDWPALKAFVGECLALATEGGSFADKGLGDGAPYGLSKACANAYTVLFARENPRLVVNACTPGFIATDLTRAYVESQKKTPAELGMKTPAEGARAPMHLLFGTLEGNGRYYGSDAKRSPLDRYRAPGAPEYTGP